MNPTKQFTGFLSSVSNPGQLSTTVQNITKAVLSAAALYAVVKGLDAATVTNQIQGIIDLIATAVTAGLVVWHSLHSAFSLANKLFYWLAAKPVVTTPVAVPTAVTTDGAPVA